MPEAWVVGIGSAIGIAIALAVVTLALSGKRKVR